MFPGKENQFLITVHDYSYQPAVGGAINPFLWKLGALTPATLPWTVLMATFYMTNLVPREREGEAPGNDVVTRNLSTPR